MFWETLTGFPQNTQLTCHISLQTRLYNSLMIQGCCPQSGLAGIGPVATVVRRTWLISMLGVAWMMDHRLPKSLCIAQLHRRFLGCDGIDIINAKRCPDSQIIDDPVKPLALVLTWVHAR
jgi:hypothetical protein